MVKKLITRIRESIQQDKYQYTRHALEQMFNRSINEEEIREAILNGEIIEDYPEDKRGHSCLIFGRTQRKRPLHVQCTPPPKVEIITTYEPDSKEWIDFKGRRR